MTRSEFTLILAYLAKGTGAKQTDAGQIEVYYDLLKDLPGPVVEQAARQSLLDHKFPSLPPVGVIRSHAITLMGERTLGPQAWEQALTAVRRYGRSNEARGLATLPADVAAAVRSFGWRILCDAKDDELGIVQTQFLKVYETLGRRVDRLALMPPMTPACAALLPAFGRPQLELGPRNDESFSDSSPVRTGGGSDK